MKNLPRHIIFAAFAFLFFTSSAAVPASETLEPDPEFQKTALKTMKEMWNTVRDRHYSKSLPGVNWDDIYKEYLPQVKKCQDQSELLAVLNRMVKELGLSHIYVLPPENSLTKKAISACREARKNLPAPSSAALRVPGNPGLTLCLADGRVCVLRVKPGLPADKAGIRSGDAIVGINGFVFDAKKKSEIPWDVIATHMLVGYPGTELSVDIENAKGEARTIKLKCVADGSRWLQIGAMPPIPGTFYSEIISEQIGYIYFSPFFPEQSVKIRDALKGKLKDVKALILDVRNNPGGMLIIPHGIAGWLSDEELEFGKMPIRGTTLTLRSYPQDNAFAGPIAVLINNGSGSAAEVFAAGMRDNDRAVLVGEKTSGQCLPSVFLFLSTGYRLQTVFGDFISKNGAGIEKIGVDPDIKAKQKRSDLINGKDCVLEAAEKYLLEKLRPEQ